MPPRDRFMLDDTLFMIPSCGGGFPFRRRSRSVSTSQQEQPLEEDDSSSPANNNPRPLMYMQFLSPPQTVDDKERYTPWIKRIWELHFVVSLVVILLGIASNSQSRKYIPIEPTQLDNDCNRAFLNTLAESADDPNAVACCKAGSPLVELCDKTNLPLARRLSSFPEAWLLPLMPWFLRWFLLFRTKSTHVYMWRRLGLYISIMCIRGFVLYQVLNKAEGLLRSSPPALACWYQDWLRPNQGNCHGRPFDFSDHIVLYFAQLVPIGLMETLDILFTKSIPALMRRVGSGLSLTDLESVSRYSASKSSRGRYYQDPGQHKRTTVIALVLIYLYAITMWSAHRTAAYFHTAGEVLAGYMVSMLVQLPLYYIATPTAQHWRMWFFGAGGNSS